LSFNTFTDPPLVPFQFRGHVTFFPPLSPWRHFLLLICLRFPIQHKGGAPLPVDYLPFPVPLTSLSSWTIRLDTFFFFFFFFCIPPGADYNAFACQTSTRRAYPPRQTIFSTYICKVRGPRVCGEIMLRDSYDLLLLSLFRLLL